MAQKSFIARTRPARARWKPIRWPLPFDGDGEPPRVGVRVLSLKENEQAYLAAKDYFASIKRRIGDEDPAFKQRERAELVFLAYRELDEHGAITEIPIASGPDELTDDSAIDEVAVLHAEWSRYQHDVTVRPLTSSEMEEFVDALKKDSGAVILDVLPSSWLIALCTTLANRLRSSTPTSSPG